MEIIRRRKVEENQATLGFWDATGCKTVVSVIIVSQNYNDTRIVVPQMAFHNLAWRCESQVMQDFDLLGEEN